jgi:hypothetical protein
MPPPMRERKREIRKREIEEERKRGMTCGSHHLKKIKY